MLTHSDIWTAIDRLAGENRLTASGLARRAGLDPTTFNRSKRITKDGKARWPSTESIAKILEATGASFAHFVSLTLPHPQDANPQETVSRRIPLADFRDLGGQPRFDAAGFPAGDAWSHLALPDLADPHAFAVRITDDQLEPVFPNGTILILSPSVAVRDGDRVLLRTVQGEVLVRRLRRRSAQEVELLALTGADGSDRRPLDAVASLARIAWTCQQ